MDTCAQFPKRLPNEARWTSLPENPRMTRGCGGRWRAQFPRRRSPGPHYRRSETRGLRTSRLRRWNARESCRYPEASRRSLLAELFRGASALGYARHVRRNTPGMPKRRQISSPARCAAVTASSMLGLSIANPSMGTNGITSVAPTRGCWPWWRLRSISSAAFPAPRTAAATTESFEPANVTTLRL